MASKPGGGKNVYINMFPTAADRADNFATEHGVLVSGHAPAQGAAATAPQANPQDVPDVAADIPVKGGTGFADQISDIYQQNPVLWGGLLLVFVVSLALKVKY